MEANIRLPTLRQLQFLVAVVETGHFGRAAARCHVSQSTLSAGIRELEAVLDVRLLERDRRHVRPTPAGEAAAARGRRILALARELALEARHLAEPLAGPFHLGVIPTIGPFLLPRLVPALRRAHPALHPFLHEAQTRTLLEQVRAGALDAAVVALPFELGGLASAVLGAERFLAAVPEGHPLAEAETVRAGALAPEELLLLEDGHCLTDHVLAACRLRDVAADAAFRGSSLYTLLQMVAAGEGITFVPEMAVAAGAVPPGVRLRPLAEPGPHREIALVWRPGSFRAQALGRLAVEWSELLPAGGGAPPAG